MGLNDSPTVFPASQPCYHLLAPDHKKEHVNSVTETTNSTKLHKQFGTSVSGPCQCTDACTKQCGPQPRADACCVLVPSTPAPKSTATKEIASTRRVLGGILTSGSSPRGPIIVNSGNSALPGHRGISSK